MLDDLMTEMSALTNVDVISRTFRVDRMFDLDPRDSFGRPITPYLWLTDVPFGQYDNVLKALMLRLPITIYVHERKDGSTFDVLHGGEFIEGLRNYMRNVEHSAEHQPYHRKIVNAEINVLVFRCTMLDEDVKTLLGYLV